jgi:hypothetical protein
MRVRLIPDKGGDGTVHHIIVINDTGAARLSLRDTDLDYLGNRQGYTGWEGYTEVRNANGTRNRYRRLLLQFQLVRGDNSP